jgi:hypothetical protein
MELFRRLWDARMKVNGPLVLVPLPVRSDWVYRMWMDGEPKWESVVVGVDEWRGEDRSCVTIIVKKSRSVGKSWEGASQLLGLSAPLIVLDEVAAEFKREKTAEEVEKSPEPFYRKFQKTKRREKERR